MAMPALSSAPSSVVPLAVTMSSPILRARYGDCCGGEREVGRVGEGDGAAVVAAVDDRADAGRVELRCGVDMGEERDRRGRGRAGDGGEHGAIVGDADVGRADRGELVAEEVEKVELACGARRAPRGLVTLGVDRAVAHEPSLGLPGKVVSHGREPP